MGLAELTESAVWVGAEDGAGEKESRENDVVFRVL